MTNYIPTIGLIGLVSTGKSTIINSLIGKRLLQSGVLQTTTHVSLIGHNKIFDILDEHFYLEDVKLVSDDGYKFNIVDFIGISDNILVIEKIKYC